MSEIFYSKVDTALQNELNARGLSGFNRIEKSLNFMLGKIANVELIAYESNVLESNESRYELASLGGKSVRFSEYLPTGTKARPGFLDDRITETTGTSWKNTPDGILLDTTSTTTTTTNTTKRIPPYITSADINIGDHSYGLLNKATINIKIPNPQEDFDFFESVWLRPGRSVDIIIEHPESAVITGGVLKESLPSTDKILELNPGIDDTKIKEFSKLNRYEFSGLVTNFTFSYELDTSVNVTINLTGTSNVYTDVSLLMNNQRSTNDQVDIIVGQDDPEQKTGVEAAKNKDPNPAVLSIYTDLYNEVQDAINAKIKGKPFTTFSRIYADEEFLESPFAKIASSGTDIWFFNGDIFTGAKDKYRYITLAWLINYLNRTIVSKRKDANDPKLLQNLIICSNSQDLCTSNYYEEIVSANPYEIFLYNNSNKKTLTYGNLILWHDGTNNVTKLGNAKGNPDYQFNNIAYPSTIFINLELIETIITKYQTVKSKFSVTSFLKDISAAIKRNTGGAINMALITHPEIPAALLYYDRNRININVTPYKVPMFANGEYGTIVRDFKFSAKIPESAKALSYVLNQNPEEISEENIAPYLNFMYNTSNVIRKGRNSEGSLIQERGFTTTETGESKSTAEILIEKGNAKWKEKHEKYLKELQKAKQSFADNQIDKEIILQLEQALIKYIQYPTDSVTKSNQVAAPMYPFEAELTIDGVNGFRYGDVLEFPGLPERFRVNTTFSIVNINHTVSTSGEWVTKIKCIMRPRF